MQNNRRGFIKQIGSLTGVTLLTSTALPQYQL